MSESIFHLAMRRAIVLAQRGFPAVAPNPAVGAVLIKGNRIVAEGWHEQFGQSHAEVNCLADAARKKVNPAECSMVVTLEPCNHHGKTPPCTEAILRAGVKHVMVGFSDPTSQARGGAAFLTTNGVKVESGPYAEECHNLIRDFLFWQKSSLPYTSLKMACTLDGFIATRSGKSRWITGGDARERVHVLRSQNQAVLIGGGTLHADNPLLSVRLDGTRKYAEDREGTSGAPDWLCLERPQSFTQPLAVVLSSRKLDLSNLPRLVTERGEQTVFLTGMGSDLAKQSVALKEFGVRVFEFDSVNKFEFSSDNLKQMLIFLRKELNVWRLFSEGGSRLGLNFLRAGLVQQFELHMAPCLIADKEAVNLFEGMSPDTIDEARAAVPLEVARLGTLGQDVVIQFYPGK